MDNSQGKSYVSLVEVVAIAKSQAEKYATLGIVNIELSPDGTKLILTLADGQKVEVSTGSFMVKSMYDQYNRGKVDTAQNAELLEGYASSYYTNPRNIIYSNTQQPAVESNVLAFLDFLVSTALSNENFVKALAIETQANNTAIRDIMKGDFLGSDVNLELVKSESGVIIQATPLDNRISSLENNLNIIEQETEIIDAKIEDIISGTYIDADNGLGITKTPANGITIHGQDLTPYEIKSKKNAPNGYAGLDVSAKVSSAMLPVASATDGGIVKVGNNLEITPDGKLNALGGTSTNTAKVSFMLAENSNIGDIFTLRPYKQCCSNKTDTRYSTIGQSFEIPVGGSVGSYVAAISGITDVGFLSGDYRGVIATTAISYSLNQTIGTRVEYYKRSNSRQLTLLGISNSKLLKTLGHLSDTEEFTTVLEDFTMAEGDRLVVLISCSRVVSNAAILKLFVEGKTPTHTIFNFASSTGGGGGGGTSVSISDVIGLPQVFDGTDSISDLNLTGQAFKLNDFMRLVDTEDVKTCYVRGNSTNGAGTALAPFGNILNAITGLDTVRRNIVILDNDDYTFPTTALLAYLNKFIGVNSNMTGDILLTNSNCIYHVLNHTGNITIRGNNITLIIDGELHGNLLVEADGAKISAKWWNSDTYTVNGVGRVRDGSQLGSYTFGYTALT